MKKLKLSLDDIDVSIDLNKVIEKEVEKRVAEEIKKIGPEFKIRHGTRRSGNTYRTILYAQLLASDNPDQTVVIETSTQSIAGYVFDQLSDNVMGRFGREGFRLARAVRRIDYPNGSRIFVKSYKPKDSFYYGLKNLHILYEN